MGIHGQTPNKTHQENDTKNPRKMQSAKKNNTKIEDYDTTRNRDDIWKTCKLLGSLIDTEKDINRRKILSIDAFRTLKNILNSRNNNIKIKLKAFNAYVSSVFLYNSELWTLTKKKRIYHQYFLT